MSLEKSSKTILLEHSIAKVELYSTYLKYYFAVLGNVKFIDHIKVFDLFCGEGLYKDNNEGSPLAALSRADEFLYKPPTFTPYIHFYFNDLGKSKIEKNISKIERLRQIVRLRKYHRNIYINFSEEEFAIALEKSLPIAKEDKTSRSLFFVDPYGYKEIQPQIIKSILSDYKSELILFLPISTMYRFVGPAQEKDNGQHEHLKLFLEKLYCDGQQCFTSVANFIESLRLQFANYLHLPKLYVDTFTLQRDRVNQYCMFLFSQNDIGYEKMLEAKWELDAEQGKGFKLGKQKSLFSQETFSPYPKILLNYLVEAGAVTNIDLYHFGLTNKYLPKHTTQSLQSLVADGYPISTYSLDQKDAKGYYISSRNKDDNYERKIMIILENHEHFKNRMD
ncbi:MAG: three-Cys-motif partner protein TcmP [Desulforhopalus sp.]|nr:three-Cys-motif partner protein TcmP [Desulforhopalus sp.]